MGLTLIAAAGAGVVAMAMGASTDVVISVGQALAGAALLGLAWAVLQRRHWVRELLPSLATIGLLVAAVIALGILSCGTWLQPTLTGCAARSPLALAIAVASAAGFVLVLALVPRLAQEQRT